MNTTLEHVFTPSGAAAELFNRRDSEVLLSGPAGTGKSRACLEKLHMMMLLNPGARGLIVRKTAISLTSTALVTWKQHVIKEALETGDVRFYGGSAQEPAQYTYLNGSSVLIGGMDKATKIMSSEYDVIYVQEATELTENDWEALTTRLRFGRISFQQMIADCNPDVPHHWLKVRSDKRKTVLLESRHRDNPTLYRGGVPTKDGAAYLAKLEALTGVRKLRLCDGKWAAAEGLIYEGFDPAVHLIDQFPIPRGWARWWAVDFGYRNPFVCQHWAEDPDGRLYLYREFYMTGKLVEDHAREILDVVAPADKHGQRHWIEPKPRGIICDHDAEGRATFEKYITLGTRPANKKVNEGIQAVQKRLQIAGDGKPRLFLLRDALVRMDPELLQSKKPKSTAEEIVGYIWDENKEMPVKEDDHGMDAKRYVVAERDLTGIRIRRLARKESA